jgi:hypothetical protein
MTPRWSVPRIWPGGECFILGGGPSLTLVDIDRLQGRRVIAVNDAYRIAPWADVMFYGDGPWLTAHRKALLDFAGLKISGCATQTNEPGIRHVYRDMINHGISRDPTEVRWNRSSGACAINLAVHFGVKRIVLLGFDMRRVDGQKHWHPDVNDDPGNPYPRFLEVFPVIARDAEALGVEILNATPGSALTAFPIEEPAELGIGRAREEARC